jgi:hypothetical protein
MSEAIRVFQGYQLGKDYDDEVVAVLPDPDSLKGVYLVWTKRGDVFRVVLSP